MPFKSMGHFSITVSPDSRAASAQRVCDPLRRAWLLIEQERQPAAGMPPRSGQVGRLG